METKSVIKARPNSSSLHEPERQALLGLEYCVRSCRAMLGAPSQKELSLRTSLQQLRRESQRDSVTQPSGCRVGEATLGSPGHSLPTPTGLQHGRVMGDATPLGLKRFSVSFPRVARALQPWARRRNPVGIREAGHKFLRNDKPQQLSRGEGGSISRHAGSETGAPAECFNIPRPVSLELRPLGFPWALGLGTWSL